MNGLVVRRRWLVSVLGLVLTCPPVALASAGTFHGLNAGAPIWNGNLILTPQHAQTLAATGTRALRINFRLDSGATTWNATQLNLYDQVIANARAAGFEVLGLFSNETTAGGQAAWNVDPLGNGWNSYVTQFASNARLLAERYKDDVQRWEVWNEPDAWHNPNYANDPQNAGGSYMLPRVYARLLAETYLQLDAAGWFSSHGGSLVSGGLFAHDIGGSFTTAMPYMQQVYDQPAIWDAFQQQTGRRYPWDEFGYHFYISQGSLVPMSQLASYFNAVRATQAANNDFSDVVVTEFGWQRAGSNTEELQRDNMARAYDFLESRPYVTGTYWYQWSDDVTGAWGLIDGNGNPRLSYHEFVRRNARPPGDYNGDGRVDADDYLLWKASFGSTANLAADGNLNGVVDAADYTVWRDHLAAAAATGVAVPEPSSCGSALLLALALLFFRSGRGPFFGR